MIKTMSKAKQNTRTYPAGEKNRPRVSHNGRINELNVISGELSELKIRVSQNHRVEDYIYEISDEVAVLLFSRNIGKGDPNRLYELIEDFFLDYPRGQIIYHKYPRKQIPLALIGLFMKVFLDYGTGIVPTVNTKHTAHVIRSLAKRVQIEDTPPSLSRVKPKFKTIADAQQFLLEGLIDCGPKKVKNLMKHAESPKEIFDSLGREGLNSYKKDLSEIPLIGPEFLKYNRKLMRNER